MSGKLFLKAKNEETLLPRVLRVLSKQGVDVQELNMKVQIPRCCRNKLQSESADFGRKAKNEVIWCASYY